ncbi:hypothetical protein ABID08_000014 [Rhizobium binae]|uniref:Uncharacterized protein n=1 Tax=Rhizobium binae TaxID=1138190 RepID=A0ABV2M865_9HYPH|nr:hypothetical protein [Rhizobium binae]
MQEGMLQRSMAMGRQSWQMSKTGGIRLAERADGLETRIGA